MEIRWINAKMRSRLKGLFRQRTANPEAATTTNLPEKFEVTIFLKRADSNYAFEYRWRKLTPDTKYTNRDLDALDARVHLFTNDAVQQLAVGKHTITQRF